MLCIQHVDQGPADEGNVAPGGADAVGQQFFEEVNIGRQLAQSLTLKINSKNCGGDSKRVKNYVFGLPLSKDKAIREMNKSLVEKGYIICL